MRYMRTVPKLLALMAMTLAGPAACQVSTPPTVADFLETLPDMPSGEVYYELAEESLWLRYPHGDSITSQLEAYVRSAPDNPGVAFAALSLIATHHPHSAKVILDRAAQDNLTPSTRWYLLNAAPYVLGMGDVMYMGDGTLSTDTREHITRVRAIVEEASSTGVGRRHAKALRDLYDQRKELADEPDFGLAVWHASAYLVGTLDLRDLDVLRPLLDPRDQAVFANVMEGLSLAANQDFLASLRPGAEGQITREREVAVASKAIDWWQAYLAETVDGTRLPAALSGFRKEGYDVAELLTSDETVQELLRATESDNHIIRYNAYRFLNEAYGTSFDLERIFLENKYGLSFLDPGGRQEEFEARLRSYWIERLSGGG